MNGVNNSLSPVRSFLSSQRTCTLATIGPDGQPQAADLYYAETDAMSLYFISIPGSRHATNIAHDPRVAATIHADSARWRPARRDWRDIRGIQLEGICSRVLGSERAGAWVCYTAKFPFVLADAALGRALQKVDVYCVTPRWLRWIDNSLALGHNQEWLMADGKWQAVSPG